MKTVLAVSLFLLAFTGSSEAASLAPTAVRVRTADLAKQTQDRIGELDGNWGVSVDGWGLLGVCGKKRNRPYSCPVHFTVTTIRSDGGEWVWGKTDCSLYVLSTRHGIAWIPPEFSTCPSEWLPH